MAEPASIAAGGQAAAGRIADPAAHRDAAIGETPQSAPPIQRLSTKGLLAAAGSFVIWGALPLYLHPIHELSSFQIIAHRIAWACVLVVIWLALRGDLWELRKHFTNPPILGRLVLSALLVTANWTGYVWAVGHGRVLEASLGYFINPLANVLLGGLCVRERVNVAQWTAVGIAAAAVLYISVAAGATPWIALTVATSFSLY